MLWFIIGSWHNNEIISPLFKTTSGIFLVHNDTTSCKILKLELVRAETENSPYIYVLKIGIYHCLQANIFQILNLWGGMSNI